TLAYVGIIPSSYPINNVYLWTSGPEEAVLRVAFKRGSGVQTEELKEVLRDRLPRRLGEYLRHRLAAEGVSDPDIEVRTQGLRVSFAPADIVNEVMSFGSPTPIEIAVSGPKRDVNRAHAERVFREPA